MTQIPCTTSNIFLKITCVVIPVLSCYTECKVHLAELTQRFSPHQTRCTCRCVWSLSQLWWAPLWSLRSTCWAPTQTPGRSWREAQHPSCSRRRNQSSGGKAPSCSPSPRLWTSAAWTRPDRTQRYAPAPSAGSSVAQEEKRWFPTVNGA